MADRQGGAGRSPCTFDGPMVLDYRNSRGSCSPRALVVAVAATPVTFGPSTRTGRPRTSAAASRSPRSTCSTTSPTAEQWESLPGTLHLLPRSRRGERHGQPCTHNGPRGAANAENLARQQAKIVTAINALGADVVSLEEIENSAAFGKPIATRALATLVAALNADAGADKWTAVGIAGPTVPEAEDVIRTAFIYRRRDRAGRASDDPRRPGIRQRPRSRWPRLPSSRR